MTEQQTNRSREATWGRLLSIMTLLAVVLAASLAALAGQMDWALFIVLVFIAGMLVQIFIQLVNLNSHADEEQR